MTVEAIPRHRARVAVGQLTARGTLRFRSLFTPLSGTVIDAAETTGYWEFTLDDGTVVRVNRGGCGCGGARKNRMVTYDGATLVVE